MQYVCASVCVYVCLLALYSCNREIRFFYTAINERTLTHLHIRVYTFFVPWNSFEVVSHYFCSCSISIIYRYKMHTVYGQSNFRVDFASHSGPKIVFRLTWIVFIQLGSDRWFVCQSYVMIEWKRMNNIQSFERHELEKLFVSFYQAICRKQIQSNQ